MDRRSLLALAACTIVASTALAAEKWSYSGEGAPANWGKLSEEYRICGAGTQQSPIDLAKPISSTRAPLEIHWQPMKLDIVNNGHTIEIAAEKGSYIVMEGRRFELLQFHFHHASEHTVDGKSFPLEVHFVHQAAEGDLAVLGVFFKLGAENAALAPFWSALPKVAGAPVKSETTIRPAALVPATQAHYRYAGSLTTPPCSEVVNWLVYSTPVEISDAQVKAFAALFPDNARPVQPLNHRFLLSNF